MDLVVRSDKVVTPSGVGHLDVAIAGEKIVAVAAPNSLTIPSGTRVVDAVGKIVIPGGIDPHVHCLWPNPNPDGSVGFTAPPAQVSRAALYGGTTTMVDFTGWEHGTTIPECLEKRKKDWDGKCFTDYAFHIRLAGGKPLPPDLYDQIAQAIKDGFPTFKMFTTDITPSRRGRLMLRFGDIWEVFKTLAANGGLAVIHAEDDDIVMHMYEKMIREGRVAFEHLAEAHNTLSEDLSFRRVIKLAGEVPGAVIYMMHVSADAGVQAIREARAKGQPVYGETLHQYMLYTSEDYKRPNGQIFHTYPSLKSKKDTDSLWQGTTDGTINTVATDEICCSLAIKVAGKLITDTVGGNAGVEPRVALMYTEMVEKRGYSLSRFVELISTNAARIMGLYPRKGAIASGSDADLTILDPALRRTIRKEDLHETDYTPWEGHQVGVWPKMTILRGKIVVEDGTFKGSESDGKLIKRRIASDILSGPSL